MWRVRGGVKRNGAAKVGRERHWVLKGYRHYNREGNPSFTHFSFIIPHIVL